jgi:hypothetical protein
MGTLAIFIGVHGAAASFVFTVEVPLFCWPPMGTSTSFTSVVVRSAASTVTRPDSRPEAFASNVYLPGSMGSSGPSFSAASVSPFIVTTASAAEGSTRTTTLGSRCVSSSSSFTACFCASTNASEVFGGSCSSRSFSYVALAASSCFIPDCARAR